MEPTVPQLFEGKFYRNATHCFGGENLMGCPVEVPFRPIPNPLNSVTLSSRRSFSGEPAQAFWGIGFPTSNGGKRAAWETRSSTRNWGSQWSDAPFTARPGPQNRRVLRVQTPPYEGPTPAYEGPERLVGQKKRMEGATKPTDSAAHFPMFHPGRGFDSSSIPQHTVTGSLDASAMCAVGSSPENSHGNNGFFEPHPFLQFPSPSGFDSDHPSAPVSFLSPSRSCSPPKYFAQRHV